MDYFIVINGEQKGPYPKQDLLSHGLSPESYVWCQGMSDWKRAAEVADLALLLHEQKYGKEPRDNGNADRVVPPPVYREPEGYSNYFNWKPWAIVAIVLGCIFSLIGAIFGIIALRHAGRANRNFENGNTQTGEFENKSARTFVIIAGVLIAIGVVVNLSGLGNVLTDKLMEMSNLGSGI